MSHQYWANFLCLKSIFLRPDLNHTTHGTWQIDQLCYNTSILMFRIFYCKKKGVFFCIPYSEIWVHQQVRISIPYLFMYSSFQYRMAYHTCFCTQISMKFEVLSQWILSGLAYKSMFALWFPAGRDSATFWDKGTEVSSLSRDKGTTGGAQNLAMGQNWPG